MGDVTDSRDTEAKLRRLTQLYAALSQCNQAIVRCTTQEELFSQICRAAVEFGGMKMAWVGLIDLDSRFVRVAASFGDRADEYLKDLVISVDGDSPLGRGTTGTAVRGNRPVWNQDFQSVPLGPPWHERRQQFGWRAMAILPLCRLGLPVGIFALYSDIVGAFDEDTRRLLMEMAADISFAIDNFDRESYRKRTEQALRGSEAELRAIFEGAVDGILIADPESRTFLRANRAICHMLGYTLEEVLRLDVRDIHPVENVPDEIAKFDRLARGETQLASDVAVLRKDGSIFFADITATLISIAGRDCLLGVFRDITERKTAEAKIQRLTRLYSALSRSNEAIVRCASEEELFPQICRAAVDAGGMKMAWIGFTEPETRMVHVVSSFGECADGYLQDIEISVDGDSPLGCGPTGTAIRENRPVWCQDFQSDPSTAPWHERGTRCGWGASASLPLRRNGLPVGALTLYSLGVGTFDEEVRRLLVEMAMDISFALDNFERERERSQAERAVRLNESRLRVALGNLDMAVFHQDRALRYTWMYQPQLGYRPEDVVGHTDAELLPEEAARTITELKQRVLNGETVHEEVRVATKGATFFYDLTAEPLHDDSGAVIGLTGVTLDITERKRAQQEIVESESRFRSLVEQAIAGIYIIQDGKFTYVNPRFAEIRGYDSPGELIGRASLSVVAEQDRNLVAENTHRLLAGEAQSLSYSFTGLRKDGSTFEVGVHGAHATYQGRPAVIGMMQDISEKKRAEEQIQRYIDELRIAFMSTVEVATTLSEMRDPYTTGHERRVAEIAVAIGAELGLDDHRLEGLRVAGNLHDIGKITIPAEILSKPVRLNPIEYQMIQGHPQASYDVLKAVKWPWPVAEIAWQHHERMDGSGYPQGLKGEAILPEARILAVADVIEAMSSHRPYRPGLGIAKALLEIERGRGTIYDTKAANACLRIFREKGYQVPM